MRHGAYSGGVLSVVDVITCVGRRRTCATERAGISRTRAREETIAQASVWSGGDDLAAPYGNQLVFRIPAAIPLIVKSVA